MLSPTANEQNQTIFPDKSAKSRHQNNFNIIRLFLATLVLICHGVLLIDSDLQHEPLIRIFGTISIGDLAIYGFFVLSGFLITQSWIQEPKWGRYLKKRFLRIWPGYAAAFILSVVVVGLLGGGQNFFQSIDKRQLLLGFLALQKPITPLVYEPLPYNDVNGSLWTIAYEARCYLLVALLGTIGLINKRFLLLGLVGFLGLAIIFNLNIFMPLTKLPGDAFFMGDAHKFLQLSFCFLCGACFLLFKEYIRFKTEYAVLAFIVLCAALFSRNTAYIGAGTAGAYLLFWFANLQHPILAKLRTFPDISYGVYLYGWPVQKIVTGAFPNADAYALLLIEIPLTALCGIISWFAIEKRALKFK